MANDGFNGSTVVFASATLGSLRGLSVSNNASEIDVTAASDTNATAVTGIPKIEITVDFVGSPPAIGAGSTGALTITWFDGTTVGTLTSAICLGCDIKGQMNGEITSSAKFTRGIV